MPLPTSSVSRMSRQSTNGFRIYGSRIGKCSPPLSPTLFSPVHVILPVTVSCLPLLASVRLATGCQPSRTFKCRYLSVSLPRGPSRFGPFGQSQRWATSSTEASGKRNETYSSIHSPTRFCFTGRRMYRCLLNPFRDLWLCVSIASVYLPGVVVGMFS